MSIKVKLLGKTYIISDDRQEELRKFLEQGATIVEEDSSLKDVTTNKNIGSNFDPSKPTYLING